MTQKRKPPPRGRGGKLKGSLIPMRLDQLAKKRPHIISAMQRGALAGNAACARICFELLGDLPPPTLAEIEGGPALPVEVGGGNA
ncbi:MAG: hypothetical protein ACRD3I_05395 [Terriglobales bacterium]